MNCLLLEFLFVFSTSWVAKLRFWTRKSSKLDTTRLFLVYLRSAFSHIWIPRIQATCRCHRPSLQCFDLGTAWSHFREWKSTDVTPKAQRNASLLWAGPAVNGAWKTAVSTINLKTCSLQMLARRMMVCREECLWKPRNYEITSSLRDVVFGHMVLWLIDWFQQSTRCKECHKTPLGALVLATSLELTREAKMHCFFDTTWRQFSLPWSPRQRV